MLRRDCLKGLTAIPLLANVRAQAAAIPEGRFHPAICAYSFRNQLRDKSMTYADVIRMAADARASGVDLTAYWLPDTTDETLFALKKLAYRSGVALYNVGIRARMAQPTRELQIAETEMVSKWLDVAVKLGASHVRVFGGAVPKGATEQQAIAWAVETLKRCAEQAGRRGITLGLEDDGGITTNAAPTLDIITKTGSPWVGVNLDVGNFPDDAYRQIGMCAPLATNVHFKTQVHFNGASQPADWARILKILGGAGYRGYLALEYEAETNPTAAVPELIAKMRAAIAAYSG